MPLRDRILWGADNPFSDPRLSNLDLPTLVREFRQGRTPPGWRAHEFRNEWFDLPIKPAGYYWEYYLAIPELAGNLRMVLGKGGEVYITGHFHAESQQAEWRQIIGMPG